MHKVKKFDKNVRQNLHKVFSLFDPKFIILYTIEKKIVL